MSSFVMNFLVHGPVGRLEASSGEPKKRTWSWRLRRLQVVRDAQGSSGALRCGEFWLPRSPAMSALLRRMEAFFWTLLPEWCMQTYFALRTRLSCLPSRLRLGLFGRPSFLSCLHFRLFGRPLGGSSSLRSVAGSSRGLPAPGPPTPLRAEWPFASRSPAPTTSDWPAAASSSWCAPNETIPACRLCNRTQSKIAVDTRPSSLSRAPDPSPHRSALRILLPNAPPAFPPSAPLAHSILLSLSTPGQAS